MNNKKVLLKHLTNRSRIRSLLSDTSFAEIETIIRNMQEVVEQKRSVQEKRQAAIFEKVRAGGLYTYHYQDESGQDAQWVGPDVGMMPKSFRNYLKRTGLRRKDCIKEIQTEEKVR